jgi:hypothetical protein
MPSRDFALDLLANFADIEEFRRWWEMCGQHLPKPPSPVDPDGTDELGRSPRDVPKKFYVQRYRQSAEAWAARSRPPVYCFAPGTVLINEPLEARFLAEGKAKAMPYSVEEQARAEEVNAAKLACRS